MLRGLTNRSHSMQSHLSCVLVLRCTSKPYSCPYSPAKANHFFHRGLKESGARPGQSVAIVGAGGGLGSLAQQYAKAMGLRVIAIDR